MSHKEHIGTWSVRAFYLSALWGTITAFFLFRAYQDSWILDGMLAPITAIIVFYLVSVWASSDLKQVTILSAILTFLLHVLPAMKYANVYLSTIDNTVHISLMRMIAVTGHVETLSSYSSTPGFHALVAAVAQMSGLPVEALARAVPGAVGTIGPLAFYMLCKRFSFPDDLSKITIMLSGFSLPALYTLNGTSFVIPMLISVIAVFFVLRDAATPAAYKAPYLILVMLFTAAIMLWHPGTSIILPSILLLVGATASKFYRGTMFPDLSRSFRSIGVLGLTATISFWMNGANFVWDRFVLNIWTAITADSKVALIPTRLFEIGLQYQILIALFNHARDAIIVALALCGILFLVKVRRQEEMIQFFRAYALIWGAFFGLLLAVFAANFGDQGYQRFLGYVVGLSPLLAGYGCWKVLTFLQRHLRVLPLAGTSILVMAFVAVMFGVQLYPYQPAVPTVEGEPSGLDGVPIVWLHQVNSVYQQHLMTYAIQDLLPVVPKDDKQVLADYITYQQGALFYDIDSKLKLRRTIDQKRQPAYILLHWPGTAGAFMEQAEYRSHAAIERWYANPDMSIIYDNGGSFALYYAENAQEPFYLEERKSQ